VEHLYVVSYDIREPRRWRKVYQAMHGFGERLQLSVFQCRLGKERVLKMEDILRRLVDQTEDHVVILDLGPSEHVEVRVSSIGKAFEPVGPGPVIV
jgi:CRISPR-associated protein Cas2